MSFYTSPQVASQNFLRVVPLGGLGRIGGNMMVYETTTDLIIVDCGVLFAGADEPGVDYCLPDISYVRERHEKLKGIVLTHAHEDHQGALPFVLPELNVPVWGTRFTIDYIRARFAELDRFRPDLRVFADGQRFRLGELEVQPLAVTHSIPGAVALALHTPAGVLVHTGDFKLEASPKDGRTTDIRGLTALGDAGVTLLLSDSTNAEKTGHTYGEDEVAIALREVIASAPYRVVVTTFASSIHRLQSIIDASLEVGRVVVPAGRSLQQNVQMALERGYLRARPGTMKAPEDITGLPRSQVTIIASGCQGEQESTMARLARGQHGLIHLEPHDRVVFSSRRIPGNERAVGAMVNNLYRRGVEVVDDRSARVHTSGHAFNDEQRAMLEYCRPRYFMPVHGEYRHLVKHAQLAVTCGMAPQDIFVLEDGETLELVHKAGAVVACRGEPVQAGLVYVDGAHGESVDEVVLRDRRLLGESGVVHCSVVVCDGRLVADPELVTRGLVHEDVSTQLLAKAVLAVKASLRELGSPDPDLQRQEVRRSLRRFFRRELDRRPFVLVSVLQL